LKDERDDKNETEISKNYNRYLFYRRPIKFIVGGCIKFWNRDGSMYKQEISHPVITMNLIIRSLPEDNF